MTIIESLYNNMNSSKIFPWSYLDNILIVKKTTGKGCNYLSKILQVFILRVVTLDHLIIILCT